MTESISLSRPDTIKNSKSWWTPETSPFGTRCLSEVWIIRWQIQTLSSISRSMERSRSTRLSETPSASPVEGLGSLGFTMRLLLKSWSVTPKWLKSRAGGVTYVVLTWSRTTIAQTSLPSIDSLEIPRLLLDSPSQGLILEPTRENKDLENASIVIKKAISVEIVRSLERIRKLRRFRFQSRTWWSLL